MDREFILENITVISATDLTNAIRCGIVSLEELRQTGNLQATKRRNIKAQLEEFQEEDDAYRNVQGLNGARNFMREYPDSIYAMEVRDSIKRFEQEKNEEKKRFVEEIITNPNDYTIGEIIDFDEEILEEICQQLGIDINYVTRYQEPILTPNILPNKTEDIPVGFTDVFFWGLPTSGKTAALSTILHTIKNHYTLADPTGIDQFGKTYRNTLINIYNTEGIGYIPSRTDPELTQYMPFRMKRRRENDKKYRQLSFFEISGEVFRYFYQIINENVVLQGAISEKVEEAFTTLDLVLKSRNPKIHFFFIDYDAEQRGEYDVRNNLRQENFLEAASTYFQEKDDIFRYATTAVYVIVTKSDQIQGENKVEIAQQFLDERFGSFLDVIKGSCERHSIKFSIKLFSIGSVYFKNINIINTKYSQSIIEDLFEDIKPVRNSWLRNILNR